MLGLVEKGHASYYAFVESTLSVGGVQSFQKPIPRSGIQTFEELTNKVKVNVNGITKLVVLNPEQVLCRALVIAHAKNDLSISTITSRPITPFQVALFDDDVTMSKN